MAEPLILVLNMGSTSSKVAVFRGSDPLFQEDVPFLESLPLPEQLPLRREQLTRLLAEKQIDLQELDQVVSRGGLMKPLPAGIYGINDAMCQDLLSGKYGVHPSGLGPVIARDLAAAQGISAIVLDAPSTDEFQELARFSGHPALERKSALHALSQKAAARQVAELMGLEVEKSRFIVAHLGGGITVGAHLEGRIVDCTHGLHEGPFTPERAGALPTLPLVELALSGIDKEQLQKQLVGAGGVAAYLGTKDIREVERRIQAGDRQAEAVLAALVYQVAKEIGAMATVLQGQVDAIVLTGGLTRSERLLGWLRERVSFIAPVQVVPENEMLALAEGGLRALSGKEQVKTYEGA